MLKRNKQLWAVIHYGGADALVTLDQEKPGKFYWNGTSSWCVFADDTTIVREYGWFEDGDPQLDKIELEFLKTYNVPEEHLYQSAGWLAPNGKFYPCEYWQHDSFASRLAAIYHNSLEGTRELERQRWIRVHSDGTLGNLDHDRGITQAQHDTLFDLTKCMNRDPAYYNRINGALRWLAVAA